MNTKPVLNRAPPEDWAGEMGERWLNHLEHFEGMIAPIGEALLDQAAYSPGERVIDVGRGAGGTTIEIGRRVGGRGSVLGIDLSPALIGAATRRAAAAGLPQVSFRCGDAASAQLEGPPFARLFSRFGLMFFPEPWGAFAHLHALLARRGRADFSVWAPPRDNEWIAAVMALVRERVELPEVEPRTSGPFALDDPSYVRELLTRGGFSDIGIDRWHGKQFVGGPGATPEAAVDFVFDAMSFGRLLQSCTPALRQGIRAGLVALFSSHHDRSGVRMEATAWLVRATV
jgi:SAM-dependent methyltransferase